MDRTAESPRKYIQYNTLPVPGSKFLIDSFRQAHNICPCRQRDDIRSQMPKIRVLLIEDNRLLREGIAALLNKQPDIRVVSSSGNGDAARQAERFKPHVVLLDLGLRDQNSLSIAESIKKNSPQAQVVVMDLVPAHAEVVEFVKAGVAGFILKDATIDEFLHTIRSVAEGKKVLPASLTGSLFSFNTGDRVKMVIGELLVTE